jgi:hypothetical protein
MGLTLQGAHPEAFSETPNKTPKPSKLGVLPAFGP